MATHRFTFEGPAGNRLSARMELPPNGRPRACALFAHCFGRSAAATVPAELTRALAERGIGVLHFDYAAPGETGDSSPATVEDLLAAATFLQRQYQAPALLVGHAEGGAAVLRAAATLPSVRAVATIAAPFERDTPPALGDGRALLVMHSPADEVIDVENADRLFESAPHPKSYVSLGTADHLLSDQADALHAARVIAAWAMTYLPTPEQEPEPGAERVVVRTGHTHYRTEIQARGHTVIADEPRSVGGGDLGPTPYDLLVAGLGACTAMTLRMYADRKEWPLEEITVRLRHDKIHARDCEECEEREAKIDRIEREIDVIGELTDEQRARLLEIANRCPVHRTLEGDVQVVSKLLEASAELEASDD